ncbi:MAG: DUF6745 domain-containing protein [Actinomycetota bacterium]
MRTELHNQLRAELGRDLWDQLERELGRHFEAPLRSALRRDEEHLRFSLWTEFWKLDGERLPLALGRELDRALLWWWDAYWMAIFTHALAIAGLAGSHRLNTLIATSRAVGWWWAMPDAVVFSERPSLISRDPSGLLHAEKGPALSFADGLVVYAWHGTRVPADFVDGAGWPPERIRREPNTEIRRCAIERFGWDRYLAWLGVVPVASAPDPGNPPFTVDLYDVRDALHLHHSPVRLVVMRNASLDRDGTRRTYAEMVPASLDDPLAAQAWAFDVAPDVYARIARAT